MKRSIFIITYPLFHYYLLTINYIHAVWLHLCNLTSLQVVNGSFLF